MDTLFYLAETYFHQDWDLNAPTPLGVVEAFRDREADGTVQGLRSDLEGLLAADPTEDSLRVLWLKRGRADWNPTTDGWENFRAMFDAMFDVVR
jgi:hypothetical protein